MKLFGLYISRQPFHPPAAVERHILAPKLNDDELKAWLKGFSQSMRAKIADLEESIVNASDRYIRNLNLSLVSRAQRRRARKHQLRIMAAIRTEFANWRQAREAAEGNEFDRYIATQRMEWRLLQDQTYHLG